MTATHATSTSFGLTPIATARRLSLDSRSSALTLVAGWPRRELVVVRLPVRPRYNRSLDTRVTVLIFSQPRELGALTSTP